VFVLVVLTSCAPAIEDIDEYTRNYNEGLKFYEAREYDKAILSVSMAINLDPENPSAYLLRGKSYRFVYEYEKSLQDTEKVLELNPSNADAHVLRGLIFFNTNRYEEAIEEYTTALEVSEENKLPLYYRAHAYSSIGEFELALNDLEQYLVFVPNDPNRARIEA
jgi:tetratricopeptide (TPR) repeat protein